MLVQELAADGNMVLIGTVETGGLGLSLSKLGLAECAALGESSSGTKAGMHASGAG